MVRNTLKGRYLKVCKLCGRLLPDSNFTKKQSICKYCRRTKRMFENYRITDTEYVKMWKEQKGKCAICGKDIGEAYLDVDHNHETGKVRGLLCRECNILLDNPRMNIDFLTKAEQYLKERDG